jgi:peroxiredoxin
MTPHRLLTVALLSLSLITPMAFAQEQELLQGDKDKDPQKHEHADHDKAKAKKPDPKVSAEAKALLDQVSVAYKNLQAFNTSGTLTAQIDVGGDTSVEKASVNSFFLAPNRFKLEITDAKGNLDMVMGSTGEKFYAYRPRRNDYKQSTAPKERVAFDKIPDPMKDLLQSQSPSLMSALCDDASKFLLDGVTEVSRPADVDIDGVKHPTLDFRSQDGDYRIAFNPQSHLIRRIDFNLARSFTKHRDDVRTFALRYDYTNVATVAPAADFFAWSVPDGARESVADAGGPGGGGDAEKALVGKDAPAFTLKGMDGKPVSLSDHKGSVVILDFWATWCGPCRASLPGLNKIHKELKEQGLQTFAVDLEESKDVVQPVAAKICPDIPVLFDEDSAVAKKYGVSGIPQTVIIGKDGKVKKVIIGGGNEPRIKAAAEAALKE